MNPFNPEARHGEGIGDIYVSLCALNKDVDTDHLKGLSLTGFVWTVDQETHNTVTVEFYDRDLYRDFHFTDSYSYDKACLSKAPNRHPIVRAG